MKLEFAMLSSLSAIIYSLVVLLIRPDMSSNTSGTLKKMVVELQLFRWLNFLYYLIIWVINISMHVDIDSTFSDISSLCWLTGHPVVAVL